MDKVELTNELIRIAKPAGINIVEATSLDQETRSLNLDSLDTLMFTIYLADLYGIPEEKLKELSPMRVTEPDGSQRPSMTLKMIFDFVDKHKTKEPENLAEAVKNLK
ncbi:MAG: hypothetical protein EBS60_03450 [Verrucomicrobia bacterium]|nr:hypothetical protein [Verrucomicrobiota bacterium]